LVGRAANLEGHAPSWPSRGCDFSATLCRGRVPCPDGRDGARPSRGRWLAGRQTWRATLRRGRAGGVILAPRSVVAVCPGLTDATERVPPEDVGWPGGKPGGPRSVVAAFGVGEVTTDEPASSTTHPTALSGHRALQCGVDHILDGMYAIPKTDPGAGRRPCVASHGVGGSGTMACWAVCGHARTHPFVLCPSSFGLATAGEVGPVLEISCVAKMAEA